ncbi:zinc finger domain-containing protein [Mycobacterium avium]
MNVAQRGLQPREWASPGERMLWATGSGNADKKQIDPLMAKPSKLANPDSPIVRDALTRKCGICGAAEHQPCVNGNTGRPLVRRVVHYQRARFREDIR